MFYVLSKTFAVAILLCLFFVAGGGVSQNPAWRITEMKVSGVRAVSADVIEKFVWEKLRGHYFFVYARDNSFIFPRREIGAALVEQYPRIRAVSARRIGAHTLSLEIVERTPSFLWCGEVPDAEQSLLSMCWFMDDTGFVFDRAPTFSSGAYEEIYGALIVRDDGIPLRGMIPYSRFVFARAFGEALRTHLGTPIRTLFMAEGEYRIILSASTLYPMLTGAEVRFYDGQNAETLMDNLLAALRVQFPNGDISKKKLRYIDLRFGNKVFFGS